MISQDKTNQEAIHPDGLIRRAKATDVERIYELTSPAGSEGMIMALSRHVLYSRIRDYFVWEERSGEIRAVCGLHVTWEDLGEIRSLFVEKSIRGRGLARELVEVCIRDGLKLGLSRFFALTYRPDYFGHLGFEEVSKDVLPQKVWFDCVHCVKFPQCDEVAMLKVIEPEDSGERGKDVG